MSAPVRPVTIDVISDVMCPWCYIGKRRLETALASLREFPITVRWRPYQLDPTLPPEGRDRRDYLESKFGGPERAKEIYSRIEDAGEQDGLDFNFDAIAVSPNTLDAHRVIHWAANDGPDVQDAVVERLFELFFMEGAHIGDRKILVEVARDAGMDGDIVADLLETDRDLDLIKQDIEAAQHMGVSGVPCFVIDEKFAVMGAQEPSHIVQAVRQAAMQRTGD